MDKSKIGLDTPVVNVDTLVDLCLEAWNAQNAANIVRFERSAACVYTTC
jgi:hypothetical protein